VSKWETNPLLEFHHQNCPISRQNVHFQFLQVAVAGPILGIDLLRKFKITVAPKTSQILFACTAAAPPTKPFLPIVRDGARFKNKLMGVMVYF
jgi:hypothetical protein